MSTESDSIDADLRRLDTLVETGTRIALVAAHFAQPGTLDQVAEFASLFDKLATGVRRGIILKQRLRKAVAARPSPAARTTADRPKPPTAHREETEAEPGDALDPVPAKPDDLVRELQADHRDASVRLARRPHPSLAEGRFRLPPGKPPTYAAPAPLNPVPAHADTS